MKIVKNMVWNVSYQLINLILPIITVPYISRVLGPHGVGINAFTASVVSYFVLFSNLGISTYGTREIAYTGSSLRKRTKVFNELQGTHFVTFGIASAFFVVLIALSGAYRLYYVAQYVTLLASFIDISWLFQGVEDYKIPALRNAFVKFLSLGCVFIFVRSNKDVIPYILIIGFSTLIGNGTMFGQTKRFISHMRLSFSNIKYNFSQMLVLFIPQVAIQVYLIMNKTVLGSLIGMKATGFYDSSDKIVKILLTVVTTTGAVLLPRVSKYFAEKRHDKILEVLNLSLTVSCMVSIPMGIGLCVIANEFSVLFFGSEFAEVGHLMMVEAPVLLFIAISSVVGLQFLIPTNKMKIYTAAVTTGSIFNIIVCVPFILMWGAAGAMLSTTLAEFVVCMFEVIMIRKNLNSKMLTHDFAKYFFSAFIMFVLASVSKNFVGGLMAKVLVSVSIGVVTYVLLIWILAPFPVKMLKERITNR